MKNIPSISTRDSCLWFDKLTTLSNVEGWFVSESEHDSRKRFYACH